MKENPFAEKAAEFEDKPEIAARPTITYTAGEANCIRCGKQIVYRERELKHGTVRLYCSKQCRKTKRNKQ